MNALLRDPIWQFIGAILALASVAIMLWLAFRRVYRLGIEVRIDSVASRSTALADEVQITYRGDAVPNLSLCLVRIVNFGSQAIRRDEFEGPLKLSFGAQCRVLGAEVHVRRPENLPVHLHHEPESVADLWIDPLLLNPRDSFTVKVLVAGNPVQPSLAARVTEVSEITQLSRTRESLIARVVRSLVFGMLSLGGSLVAIRAPATIEFIGIMTVVLLAFLCGALLSIWLDRRIDRDRLR